MNVDTNTGEIRERHVRPFAEWLHEHRQGALANELAESLNGLTDAVNTYHKGGSLVLTVKIRPAARGEGMVIVTDDVTVKVPTPDTPESFYFVDNDVNLSRSNPAQPQLPLREVPHIDGGAVDDTEGTGTE